MAGAMPRAGAFCNSAGPPGVLLRTPHSTGAPVRAADRRYLSTFGATRVARGG